MSHLISLVIRLGVPFDKLRANEKEITTFVPSLSKHAFRLNLPC